jgi:hypothetical protein
MYVLLVHILFNKQSMKQIILKKIDFFFHLTAFKFLQARSVIASQEYGCTFQFQRWKFMVTLSSNGDIDNGL